MSWQERLLNANFREIEFLTDSHEAKSGRRLVVHEYPHADEPELEDFGLQANSWHLNAYFIGENYDLEANAFLAKLSLSGADWLNHPWLGQLWVRAKDWSRSESNDKGGYCVISIDFVPGGHAPVAPVVDKVDVAYQKISECKAAIIDNFALEAMSSDGLTAFTADTSLHLEGLRNIISLTSLPLTWANQILNVIAGVKNDISVLMKTPQQYANALGSFADVLGFGADTLVKDVSSATRAGEVSRITNVLGFSTNALDEGVSSATRARAVARITNTAINPPAIEASANTAVTVSAVYKINTKRESALRSQLLLVAAAQLGLADYDNANNRDAVLDQLLTAIDTMLPSMPDAVFQAAVSARRALIEALLDQDLSPQVQRDIANPLPSVLLAHQMGIAEDVFIATNNVRHPLFVVGRVYG